MNLGQIFLTISFIFTSSNGGLESCLGKIRSKLKCCSADHIWNSTSNLHFWAKTEDEDYTVVYLYDPVRGQNSESSWTRFLTTIYGSKDFLDGSSTIKKLTLHAV